MSESGAIPVVALLGPTAVGKSGWAFKVADENGWEILSCDSRQIYRGMNIGTAKPSREELRQVRHWMVDICNPDEEYNAFRFAHEACALIRECAARKIPVLICGGTGLYFKALCEGQKPLEPTQPQIRRQLLEEADGKGTGPLYAELTAVDPESAGRIHRNDLQRIIRALGYFRQTGQPISREFGKGTPPKDIVFYIAKMTTERERLYDRINLRAGEMFANGLYEEFRSLRSKGFEEGTPGLMTVGYRELFELERGTSTLERVTEAVCRNSRRYAKRQITWFSRQLEGTQFDAETQYDSFRDFAIRAVEKHGPAFI